MLAKRELLARHKIFSVFLKLFIAVEKNAASLSAQHRESLFCSRIARRRLLFEQHSKEIFFRY